MRDGDTDSGRAHHSEGPSLLILLHEKVALRLRRRKRDLTLAHQNQMIPRLQPLLLDRLTDAFSFPPR